MPEEVYLTTTETPDGAPDRGRVRAGHSSDHDVYEIVGREAEWRVAHEGGTGMAYATRQAAFEAAVAAAANALKDGHDVTIHVAGGAVGESALGNPPA